MSYINLAKRFLNEHGEVHFAALGVAISPMVTAAEILKNRRLAIVSRITTSLETLPDDQRYAICHLLSLPIALAGIAALSCVLVYACRRPVGSPSPCLLPICSTGNGRSPRWRSSCISQLILTRL